jgi:hypothetical protein
MTSTAASGITVSYEGGGVGSELWGMTQANFMVHVPGRHTREVAVMLNETAGSCLARELGQADTPAFRLAVANQAGKYWIECLAREGHHLDSAITMSSALLDERPDILKHLKKTRL